MCYIDKHCKHIMVSLFGGYFAAGSLIITSLYIYI
jgi:hypothetical protein